MKISLNWLKDWIDFTENDAEKLAHILSDRASEVEEIIKQGEGLEKVFVGQILEITAHPDADRMQVTKTKVGDEIFQIVCGAKNISVGIKVPVALVGAVLPGGFEIKKADKRGVESCGMICSEIEMGIADHSDGIMILPEDAVLGMPITEYLGLNDTVFDIENTTITNRPDLFSHRGFVREFTALGLATWKGDSTFKVGTILKVDTAFPLHITIANPEICPKMCGVIIKNFKVAESPEWIKKRLNACGVRPINNLVDITNFVMLEMGMPLHAFDLGTISGKTVTMRTSKAGEKVTTLDGQERELPENVIILEDEKKIFDLCGIMGGENSGVRETTSSVWIHAPIYDPVRIRRASVALSHRTDASVIYEKRVPSILAMEGLFRARDLAKALCPTCEVASKILDIDNDPEKSRSLTLRKSELERVLGEPIADAVVDGILKNLGFGIKNTANSFEIEVPPFRFKDIAIEADIIEEVIRIYGLSNIKAELPMIQMTQARSASGFTTEKIIKNALANSAYENINFSFLNKKLLERANFSQENLIEVANPISEDLQFMRPSLLPYLLEKMELNKLEEDSLSLFEIGRVFDTAIAGREKKHLAFVAYNSDFLSVKGVLESLFETLGLTVRIQPSTQAPSYAHPGQVAELNFQGKSIGTLASLHPSVAKNFHLNKTTVFFELSLEEILSSKTKAVQYQSFNKLPKAERDQNFILDKMVLASDFVRKISKASPLLVDIKIVDVYEGEHIEKGLKSLTIRAVYQSTEKTLTDAEVDAMQQLLVVLAQKNGAKLRG